MINFPGVFLCGSFRTLFLKGKSRTDIVETPRIKSLSNLNFFLKDLNFQIVLQKRHFLETYNLFAHC